MGGDDMQRTYWWDVEVYSFSDLRNTASPLELIHDFEDEWNLGVNASSLLRFDTGKNRSCTTWKVIFGNAKRTSQT